MNRTQRAIKKSYRDGENESKRMKNKMIEKCGGSAHDALFDRKGMYNGNVKIYAREEKECRSATRDYMRRARKKKEDAAA